jgi:cell division protease FtsH
MAAKGNEGSGSRPLPAWLRLILAAGFVLTVLLVLGTLMGDGKTTPPMPYTDFLTRVDTGQVQTVSINGTGAVQGTLSDGT